MVASNVHPPVELVVPVLVLGPVLVPGVGPILSSLMLNIRAEPGGTFGIFVPLQVSLGGTISPTPLFPPTPPRFLA